MKKKISVAVLLLGLVAAFGAVVNASSVPLDNALLRAAEKEAAARRPQLANRRYLTIIDYRKNLLQKRLWVYDRTAHRVVLNTRVSHAFKSGLLYATRFSNVEGTNTSCAGTFITQVPYTGRFGLSLRLRGVSKGENTNALQRAIIFHPDPGYRWSNGCFMTDKAINAQLIERIKGGSLIYVAR